MRILTLLVPALLGSTVLAQENRLTSARLDGDVLRLDVSAEPQAVRHFPLPNPPRVVVDLFGIDRSAAEMPAPPDGSPAFEVRTGEHADFLRVVLDLRAALPSYQVRQSGGLVEVGLGAALPPSATGVLVGESPVPGPAPTPRPAIAPVVDVGVEAAPAEQPATASTSPASPAPAPAGSALQNLDDLTTDELLELIDEELAALDQQQSAEELIEQVEAELAARPDSPAAPAPPPDARPPAAPERTPIPVDDPANRPPFRFIDEKPDPPPGS